MRKKKLNLKKVILGYFIIIFISIIVLLFLPNTYEVNLLWAYGFITGIILFTCLIEGSKK